MREVLVNRLGGLSLPRKSVVRLTDRPDMTLDVNCGSKTTTQQQQQNSLTFVTQVLPIQISVSCLALISKYKKYLLSLNTKCRFNNVFNIPAETFWLNSLSCLIIYYCLFQGGISVVVP